jgi:hypothetical protein
MPLIAVNNFRRGFMRSNFKLRRPFDPIIPVVGIVLSIIGLVMILSASQITAADDYGNPYHFFTRQLVAWGIGLVLFFYFFRVSLDTLYKNHWRLFAASLIMLALVLIPGIGGQVNGARRWINFHFLLFQPAEVVKFFSDYIFCSLAVGQGGDDSIVQPGDRAVYHLAWCGGRLGNVGARSGYQLSYYCGGDDGVVCGTGAPSALPGACRRRLSADRLLNSGSAVSGRAVGCFSWQRADEPRYLK